MGKQYIDREAVLKMLHRYGCDNGSALGKTVFPTREAAEKALIGIMDGNT